MKDIGREIQKYLVRLKNGEDCFEKFYMLASAYVQYIAYKYLVDKSFTDDVVINTFSRVSKSIESFDENKNGYAWICKIAQNEAYKINSREMREELPLDSLEYFSDDANEIEDQIHDKFNVERSIAELDETDMKIIELRIYKLMSFKEIAKELDMPIATIYYRLTASYKTIKEKLEQD